MLTALPENEDSIVPKDFAKNSTYLRMRSGRLSSLEGLDSLISVGLGFWLEGTQSAGVASPIAGF